MFFFFFIFTGFTGSENSEEMNKKLYNGSSLLNSLLNVHKQTGNTTDGHLTYSEMLKDIASYLYLNGGKYFYDFLSHNIPLPPLPVFKNYIYNEENITDGKLRIKELKKFLLEQNLPLKVWLSNNSIEIVDKIRYCKRTNQIVGFVLPSDENGMPTSNVFEATSAKTIKEILKNGVRAKTLNFVIAQALSENAPFFCLLMHGTNRGTNDDCSYEVMSKRLEFIKNELKREGIEVIGQSTNGDSRNFKEMRLESGLIFGIGNFNCSIPEFKAHISPEYVYMQDTAHIAVKLITRLVKTNNMVMFMGNHDVRVSDLDKLITLLKKNEHGLTSNDINCNVDKINFDSVLKISQQKITKCLNMSVPNSEATQQYLKLIQLILISTLDVDLFVECRIYCLWYCVFFLRLWRSWLLKNKNNIIAANCFITLNNYVCIEINAHGLYNLVLKCIKDGSFEYFFPYMHGFQPCERFLKLTTTAFKTSHNRDLLSTMDRIKNIELLSKIVKKNYKDDSVIFPNKSQFPSSFNRLDKKDYPYDYSFIPNSLPHIKKKLTTINDKLNAEKFLKDILRDAKLQAFKDAEKFGMVLDPREANIIQIKIEQWENNLWLDGFQDSENDLDDTDECNYFKNIFHCNTRDSNEYTENDSDSESENDCLHNHDENDVEYVNKNNEEYDCKNKFDTLKIPSEFVQDNGKVCKNCPYTYVSDEFGQKKLVKKSSLVKLNSNIIRYILTRGGCQREKNKFVKNRETKQK